MQALHAKTPSTWDSDPFVVRITKIAARPEPYRAWEALILSDGNTGLPGFKAYFHDEDTSKSAAVLGGGLKPIVQVPSSLSYLTEGDIVRVAPRSGDMRVLYRKNSRFNSLLVTHRCNSKCVMCSQPPRDAEDAYLIKDILEALPLMGVDTPELVITGGEPTLLQDDLLRIIRCCASYLPHTSVLLLSNGRFFTYLTYCEAMSKIRHPGLTIGIPLYSCLSNEHDFIVQVQGAFDQTIRGIMNLGRCHQRIELRVVIHRLNYERLPELAEFITRNFPFVAHVALMGMEPTGYAKANLDQLWVDPNDYSSPLHEAVRQLSWHHICTSVYNHQLCTLHPDLWRYARQSISDWKKVFLEECGACSVREQCCGFFASAADHHGSAIKAIRSRVGNEAGSFVSGCDE
jgi:His-Xaa-Ser system radical SAM maturase HxsC